MEDVQTVPNVGEVVRIAREASGLSQAVLGSRCGVMQSTISRIESGGQVPDLVTLGRLAAAMGLELVVSMIPPPGEGDGGGCN